MENQLISLLKKKFNFCAKIGSRSYKFYISIFFILYQSLLTRSFLNFWEICRRQYLTCRKKYEGSKPKII